VTSGSSAVESGDLGILLDVPLEVRAELGSCTLQIKEILELGEGSVVELARKVGEPVDLLVNDTVVARGDIVAVDDGLAIRITALAGRSS